MRHALLLTLSLIAAAAPPIRLACANACVMPDAHQTAEPEAPSCHGATAPAESPAPLPLPDEDCSHDHSTTIKPGARVSVEPATEVAHIGSLQSAIGNRIADCRLQITDSPPSARSARAAYLPLRI